MGTNKGKLGRFKMKINIKSFAPYIILATAVTFIAIGVLREEHLVVLKKAVNICLECIGVG